MRLQRIVVLVAGLWGFAAVKAHAADLSSNLQVESRAGQVLVHVEVHNGGTATIYLPRALAADPQPLGKTFQVTVEPGGAPVDYTGRMVKRGSIGPDDFIAIQPKGTLRHTLDISNSYAFLPGEHSYTLQYAGGAVASLKQLDRTQALAPAPARFIHTGR
jgi:hypothetical protein